MFKSKIFLIGKEKGTLVPLEESEYVSEDALQDLLAKYPDLLPGDQIEPDDPCRWMLVTREMPVPDVADGAGRWSLDHLFLDQFGIPTFVECKRATDTRTRREVVVQMLDYAANGVQYWSVDQIKAQAEKTAEQACATLEDQVSKLLGADKDQDAYWSVVEGNLAGRRIRLIFVTDSTPSELRRLVEFLNEEMENVRVLAIELKQYQSAKGDHPPAIAPRVIGLTEAARRPQPTRPITQEEFLAKCAPGAKQFFTHALDQAAAGRCIVYWGRVGLSLRADLPTGVTTFAYCWAPRRFEFYFAGSIREPTFADALRRKILATGLFKEGGNYYLRATVDEANLEAMVNAFELMLNELDKFAAELKPHGES